MKNEKTEDYKEKIDQAIKISRIKVDSDVIVSQIEEIIHFFEMIDKYDVKKENSTISFLPIDVENVLRDDEVEELDWTLKDSEILKLGTKL